MDKNPIPKNSNLVEDDRGSINDPTPIEQLEIPEFADGVIVSGPEDGYLAMLHGRELITPLDDNYTQPEVITRGEEIQPKIPNIQPVQSTKSKVSLDSEKLTNKQNTINIDNISPLPKTTLLNNNVNMKNLNPLASSSKQIAILPITRYIKTPSSNNPSNINIASRYQPAPVSS